MRKVRQWCGVLAGLTALVQSVSAQVPTGKLPAEAQPLGYSLAFKIDPHADRFSGQTHIRIKLAQPADHVWLHSREIDIAKAELTDAAGKTRKVEVAERDPSGVIEVKFGATLPAQNIDLSFDYSAPFNAKLQGLYKVKLGDESYVVTQMEAISARYAFPASTSRASRRRSTSR